MNSELPDFIEWPCLIALSVFSNVYFVSNKLLVVKSLGSN